MGSETFSLVRRLLTDLPEGKEFEEVDNRIARLSLKLVRERSAEVPKEQRPDEHWIRVTAKSNLLTTAKGRLVGGRWRPEDYAESSPTEVELHRAYQLRFLLLALHNLEVLS